MSGMRTSAGILRTDETELLKQVKSVNFSIRRIDLLNTPYCASQYGILTFSIQNHKKTPLNFSCT